MILLSPPFASGSADVSPTAIVRRPPPRPSRLLGVVGLNLRLVALACTTLGGSGHLRAAEPVRPFSQTLTPEQKERLGLAHLTVAQLAELDAAVGAFTRGETTVAVSQAVRQVERQTEVKVQEAEKRTQEAERKAAVAAEAAVDEYKQKQEPGVVARTLEVFKRRQEEERLEKFTARVVGPFRGWGGGTYFPLENGQVWRQVGTESYELPVRENAEVEIYQSRNGYWRLRYEGAWITVKRLQ